MALYGAECLIFQTKSTWSDVIANVIYPAAKQVKTKNTLLAFVIRQTGSNGLALLF
jgi:hypothetical protein